MASPHTPPAPSEPTLDERVDIPILLSNMTLLAARYRTKRELSIGATFIEQAVKAIEYLQAELLDARSRAQAAEDRYAALAEFSTHEIGLLHGALAEQKRMFAEWLDDMGYAKPSGWNDDDTAGPSGAAEGFTPPEDVAAFREIRQRSMEGDMSHSDDLARLCGIADRALDRAGLL
jgi:hypothetical protein